MSLYRVKQFVWGIQSYFKKVDSKYIDKYLDKSEKELFNMLKHSDKHHSIRVSKDAIKIVKLKGLNIDNSRVAKVALLHDIGKGEHGLNVVEKSALVLLNNITRGKIKRFTNLKRIDTYYNHGEKGADLLKDFKKYDKEFLDVIRYHHGKSNKEYKNNKLLNIIKESDNRN